MPKQIQVSLTKENLGFYKIKNAAQVMILKFNASAGANSLATTVAGVKESRVSSVLLERIKNILFKEMSIVRKWVWRSRVYKL